MKKIIFFVIIIAFCMTGCLSDTYDFKTGEKTHMTYVLLNGFECVGHIATEERGYGKFPMLICDDGTVYHNVSNYRAIQPTPLCTESK